MPEGRTGPAMLSAAQMLDQLMGGERDVALDKRTNKVKQFHEPDICKHLLCGICPHDSFRTTKSDLGPCRFTCTDAHTNATCKEQWDALTQEEKDKYGYEYDLYMLLDDLTRNLDRKIASTRASMAAEQKANERAFGSSEDHEEEKKVLLAKVEEITAQAEAGARRPHFFSLACFVSPACVRALTQAPGIAAGDEGDVEKAMELMEQTKALSEQAEQVDAEIAKTVRAEGTGPGGRRFSVCDVCGVNIHDGNVR
jgi:hypothetical protein